MVTQAGRGPLDRADPWSQEWGRPRFYSQLEAKNKVDKKRSLERRVAALLVVVMVTALLPVGGMQPVAVASSGNSLRISQGVRAITKPPFKWLGNNRDSV